MIESAEPQIRFEGIRRVYGEGAAAVHALDGIDLSVQRGEFLAIMGSSGSGKSTCMNILGCLDTPTSGQYRFLDADVGSLDRRERSILRRLYIGFIFQGFNLLARATALENVELPLLYRRIDRRQRRSLALAALDRVGLLGRETHLPSELSGGQQQRVAIARAIAGSPQVVLADEPTGNLDTPRSHEVMSLLREQCTIDGVTVIMVTHEDGMAEYASRRLEFADGHIVSNGRGGQRLALGAQ